MSMNKRRRVGRPKGAGKRFTKTKLKPASEKASIIKSYKWTAEQRARIAQACQMSSLREATIVKAGTMAMVDTIINNTLKIQRKSRAKT